MMRGVMRVRGCRIVRGIKSKTSIKLQMNTTVNDTHLSSFVPTVIASSSPAILTLKSDRSMSRIDLTTNHIRSLRLRLHEADCLCFQSQRQQILHHAIQIKHKCEQQRNISFNRCAEGFRKFAFRRRLGNIKHTTTLQLICKSVVD